MRDQTLATQTDLCVKCGLCLPHCPTYLKTSDENESPRGRLSLIQGWARDELEPTPTLIDHVDNCLLCRACESVCPAYVPYGQIVDRFRAETQAHSASHSLLQRVKKTAVRQVLTHARLAPLTDHLLSGRSAGLVRSMAHLAGGGLTDGLPPVDGPALPAPGSYRPNGVERGAVSLFLGCTASLADRATVAAAMRLFDRLGLRVEIPATQTCCGALNQHAGLADEAARQQEQNRQAFDPHLPIVSFASGCGAMLTEYSATSDSSATDADFPQRVRDISRFLAECEWPAELRFKPLSARACLHAPCSLRHVLRTDASAGRLLQRIPDLSVTQLPSATRCCGAAGSYLIDHPDMAAALRDDVLDAIVQIQPTLLLTSNPGCAMHLRAGLRQRGLTDLEVLHPIVLLARQLA